MSSLVVPFRAMASTCEIHVEDDAPPEALRAAVDAAIAEVARIEAKYSRYRDDSVLSRINAAAGAPAPVPVDDETAALLDFSATLHADSEGRFDVTSGVLRRSWDFRTGRVPTQAELDVLLPLVGWSQVERPAGAVRLPRAGMELDFGGIGKEYAADRAATVLAAAGLKHGYVNLGGDLRLLGPRPDGRPWSLGVRHPRQPEGVIASLVLADGALATSGDYERFFVHEGRRYCHILDPRTGWPATHWQSVSVVAPACVAAGALTTIAMLMGPEATAFLAAQGVPYLAIDESGAMHRGTG